MAVPSVDVLSIGYTFPVPLQTGHCQTVPSAVFAMCPFPSQNAQSIAYLRPVMSITSSTITRTMTTVPSPMYTP